MSKLSEVPNLEFAAGVLQYIDLDSNSIVDVGAFYGLKYPNLKNIRLATNQLTVFCVPPTRFAPRLRRVLLHSNNSTNHQLPVGMHDTDFLLGNNPWHCDGSLSWVRKCSPSFFPGYLECPRYVDLRNFACHSPANMHGLSPLKIGKQNPLPNRTY